MTDAIQAVEQCTQELVRKTAADYAIERLLDPDLARLILAGEADGCMTVEHFAKAIIQAQSEAYERAAKVAHGFWVEADYDLVGIHDADKAMELCRQSAQAIRSLSPSVTGGVDEERLNP